MQFNSIFKKALDRAPGDRPRFVQEACAGDDSLFKEVQALILSHEEAGSFLESPSPAIGAGSRFGPYEVRSSLGAGGMGEVYRAHDTSLKRDVALKVLPQLFAADADRLERFKREAQLLAAIDHPNIAQVYGLEQSGATRCIVLELVEGETLQARIKKGAIPVDEALAIARQIAEALEAAHEKGIIHRDLKPANIKITPDSKVKVLDFGLAKTWETSAGEVSLSKSPTISVATTQAGLILGTAAYMSPEQARGLNVDKRSDIWAFGAVLYEMLTGRQAFGGENVTDIIAAVVKEEPKWTLLPAATPTRVQSLLRRCLQKEPRNRLHAIADVRIAIEDAESEPGPAILDTIPAAKTWRWVIPGFLACLLVGGFLVWKVLQQPVVTPPITRFDISLQPAEILLRSDGTFWPTRTAFAISPDGQTVVFSAWRPGTQVQLYARRLAESEAKPIPGTDAAVGPFFSPDGQWIGFSAMGQLKKVPVKGGPPTVICDMPSRVTTGLSGTFNASWYGPFGASWAEDGTIYFSDTGIILKVESGGGTPVRVTVSNAEKGEQHVVPQPAPGGKSIIFTSLHNNDWDNAQIVIQSLETHERHVLIEGGADARYVPTGHLLYMKTGKLMAVAFDARSLQVRGDPVALIDNVMQAVNVPSIIDQTGAGQWAVSSSGTLLYVSGGVQPNLVQSLVWVDRKGTAQPISFIKPGAFTTPRISPDKEQIAVGVHPAGNNNFVSRDIYIYNLLRGTQDRLTSDVLSLWEVWSPDGKRLAFSSNRSGANNIYVTNVEGTGPPERLTISPNVQAPSSWTSNGNLLAFVETHPSKVNWKIWVLPMDGDRKPKLFYEEPSSLNYPTFSPDGCWMAYVSIETGHPAVYVRPYPGPGQKQPISPGEGTEPIWSADGHELFYRQGTKFFAVKIRTNPFQAEPPIFLFEGKTSTRDRRIEYALSSPVRFWDIDPSGQRFLLIRDEETKDMPVTQIHAVLNWTEELKQKVPVAH